MDQKTEDSAITFLRITLLQRSKAVLSTELWDFLSFPFLDLLWRGVKLAVVDQTEEVLIASEKAMRGPGLT